MSDASSPEDFEGSVRTLQIVAAALAFGSATFLAIVLVIRGGKALFAESPWDVMPPKAAISMVALVAALLMVVLSIMVPRMTAASLRKNLSAGPSDGGAGGPRGELPGLYLAYQTQMILGMAMLEGAALFNAIAFLIEGRVPNLIAAATLLLLILARFPTTSNVRAWVEDQAARLLEERQSA